LEIADEIERFASEACVGRRRVLSDNLASIAERHEQLDQCYQRFREKVAWVSTEELANGEGDNVPLMAADDAIVLVKALAVGLRTRSGAQQIEDNIRSFRQAVGILDKAAVCDDTGVRLARWRSSRNGATCSAAGRSFSPSCG